MELWGENKAVLLPGLLIVDSEVAEGRVTVPLSGKS